MRGYQTFFTADTHFGHEGILTIGRGRPFASIEEHDEALIEAWNSVVGNNDEVWHLGDFVFKVSPERATEIFKRLKGRKKLCVGNHDKAHVLALPWSEVRHDLATVSINKQRFALFHYPMIEWPGFWSKTLHLHGHTHDSVPSTKRRLDVAVDAWGWKPATVEQILERAKTLPDPNPRFLTQEQMPDATSEAAGTSDLAAD